MPEVEIRIRLAEDGMAFVYSIVRPGAAVETAIVHPVQEDTENFSVTAYHGGSQAMD